MGCVSEATVAEECDWSAATYVTDSRVKPRRSHEEGMELRGLES